MNRLLRLKHWQLFMLLFGIPFFLQIVLMGVLFISRNPDTFLLLVPIVMILYMGIFFAWMFTLGVNLHRKLPHSVRMNLRRFKAALMFPLVYTTVLSLLLVYAFRNPGLIQGIDFRHILFMLPLHILSMVCTIYCLYFIAKELKAAEAQSAVQFGAFASEFLLIWFFPVGVWFLQPRINKLFNEHPHAGTNAFG